MSDQGVLVWLALMLVVELAAVGLVAWMAVSDKIGSVPVLMRVGLLVACFGLMVQVVRSIYYFEFGVYPVDHYFPLWVTKDLGLSMIIFHVFFKLRRHERADE